VGTRGIQRRARSAIGGLVVASGLLLAGHLAGQLSTVAAEEPAGGPPASRSTCQYAPTHRTTQVREAGIREASALVASQQFPGIYWTLNDSGNAPVIFAFDQDGAPRGSFRVTGATNVDWEALQIGPDDDGGYALYIGDIGDNDQLRREPVVYRVPEPEPAPAGGPSPTGETAPATAFRFLFPGRPHNSEAMLVHPKTGEIMLITREISGMSMIYRLPLPLDSSSAPIADLVDVVNVRGLDPASGQVTDAAISSDGQHVALRTYSSVLVYDVPDGVLRDRLWEQVPAIYRIADGPKGEGITFRLDSDDLMSVGEETPTWLYQTGRSC